MAVSFTNNMEYDLLNMIKGVQPSWDTATSFYWAAYTAAPGEAGSATSNEITGIVDYARVATTRLTEITVSASNVLSNAVLISFPLGGASSTSGTITHVCLVNTLTGSGSIMLPFELPNSIPYGTGIQPQIGAGAATFSLD
ncbi:hypothetical protein UFOVP903_5 [uncultured Caudovirales phage]|uniref:Uncharacterized protein n=1 Tax=uncultured Caudovirales phage TaxID=2100421 RepID=A0A6J5PKM6_9CAUD|nr:hypothetical protein UFOVP903_5 [uncultured Caudovirales phage]CAB4197872.1 hypothetical protein UFOVP1318_41 [uncultured Caudovirales phage]CAB4210288.1 hypothetical protein UFOVP1430_3 [uncultured Caudovirales phage]